MQLSRTIRKLAIATAIFTSAAFAQDFYSGQPPVKAEGKPQSILNVGIDQKLNQQLPLDLQFRDELGKPVKLGDYFGKKPVVLTLVYYTCPMLCSEVETGMASVFKVLKFDPGR